MILTSHQPDFLPYMGFFYKVARSDVLVLSDDVQFSKSGMHNWNRIKTPAGAQKLTIPVHAHHDTPLCRVEIADPGHGIGRAVKTIEQHYRKAAPHYGEGAELLEIMQFFSGPGNSWLTEMNENLILHILDRFGIKPLAILRASALGIQGHKDERIFQMCEETGADTYLSGRGAANYHEPYEYMLHGIDLIYTDYEPVQYQQLYGEFIPNLSVLDYIFNCGYELPRGWI
ncbi:WbqC family protein [Clostridium sp. DFI.5.61]|uniref:WbqC family protein n=1 Tax=Clostridium sp. DFI.5.61 TaxID=2965279 RepID=UPI00210C5D72|nr:WbqC family protein [Clostridium sp. DFI.5.61]MCB5924209.1 WbqC family protein [bacterium 210820-DFI.5.26]MCQ5157534.1 WbqC family protein [Clostridium sp. DFI.5.61]